MRTTRLSRSVANLQLAIVYGYTNQSGEDPLVNDTKKLFHHFTAVPEPGECLVDVFPFRELFYLDYGEVPILTLPSEVSAGLVPWCRFQKNCERMARIGRRYV